MSNTVNNCQFSEYSHNDCMCTDHLSSFCLLVVYNLSSCVYDGKHFLSLLSRGERSLHLYKFKRELSEDCYNFKRDDKLALEYYNQNYHRQWFDFCKNIRIFKQKTTTWKKCQKLSLSIAYRLNFIVLIVDNIYRYKIKFRK
jgi:hypothetical protein